MSDNGKSTRDIVIETNAVLKEYIKHSNERREICGRRFDDQEARLRKTEVIIEQTKGGWKTLSVLTAAGGVVGGLLVKFFKP